MLSDVIINVNENTAILNVPIGLIQLHITNLFPVELAKVMIVGNNVYATMHEYLV